MIYLLKVMSKILTFGSWLHDVITFLSVGILCPCDNEVYQLGHFCNFILLSDWFIIRNN